MHIYINSFELWTIFHVHICMYVGNMYIYNMHVYNTYVCILHICMCVIPVYIVCIQYIHVSASAL